MTDRDSTMAMPRPGVLRREIIGLLAIKLIALTALYFAFFGPSARPHITTPDLAAHITTGANETH
jgi:hypothetical protein